MSERSGTARVLVVEDDEDVRTLVGDILRPHGFEVVGAKRDEEAYAALSESPSGFSAFIIDIDLGEGTTGFDVARYARRIAPATPVIFISGVDDGAAVGRFGVPGSVFLRKPFTPDDLLQVVRRAAGDPSAPAS